jgi:hypothetical protein
MTPEHASTLIENTIADIESGMANRFIEVMLSIRGLPEEVVEANKDRLLKAMTKFNILAA